jgi:hypothetical protein
LSKDKDSTGGKEKEPFKIKLHAPKNPFKGNPFKKDKE